KLNIINVGETKEEANIKQVGETKQEPTIKQQQPNLKTNIEPKPPTAEQWKPRPVFSPQHQTEARDKLKHLQHITGPVSLAIYYRRDIGRKFLIFGDWHDQKSICLSADRVNNLSIDAF